MESGFIWNQPLYGVAVMMLQLLDSVSGADKVVNSDIVVSVVVPLSHDLAVICPCVT